MSPFFEVSIHTATCKIASKRLGQTDPKSETRQSILSFSNFTFNSRCQSVPDPLNRCYHVIRRHHVSISKICIRTIFVTASRTHTNFKMLLILRFCVYVVINNVSSPLTNEIMGKRKHAVYVTTNFILKVNCSRFLIIQSNREHNHIES